MTSIEIILDRLTPQHKGKQYGTRTRRAVADGGCVRGNLWHPASWRSASTTAGALLRCGIYKLGSPNGDLWDIGDRVADFGTLPADVADNKEFNLGAPQTLTKGWYVTAMGVSGAGAYARYARWMTPGLTRFYPHSSGTSAYPQTVAPQVYLYASSSNAEITGGLPATWPTNPVTTMTSTNNWVYQMVFPKWREV